MRPLCCAEYVTERCAHLDPIFNLDLATGVDTDVLQGFARTVVGLAARLQRVEDIRLVHPSWGLRGNRAVGCVSWRRSVGDTADILEAVYEVKELVLGDLWVFLTQTEGLHGWCVQSESK